MLIERYPDGPPPGVGLAGTKEETAERGSEHPDELHQNFVRCPCCKYGYFLYHPKPKNHCCPYCGHLTTS